MVDRTRQSERGSAMLLVPAALIIVALFASLTLDAAHAFLMQRELTASADAMANDAIAAIDTDRVYEGAAITLVDDGRLRAVVEQSRLARISDVVSADSVTVRRIENAGVEIALSATVHPYFSRMLHSADWKIRATARAYPVADND